MNKLVLALALSCLAVVAVKANEPAGLTTEHTPNEMQMELIQMVRQHFGLS